MIEIHKNDLGVTTVHDSVDDAVGVGKNNWYVAIVNNRTEKASALKLAGLGYGCFVATQQELHIWKNGRRAKVDRIVIPSMVFIHCTETERRKIVTLPFIFRFLTNKASNSSPTGRPVAIIPPFQMQQLRFMLGKSDRPVEFVEGRYRQGDKVRIIRGSLCGLEGEVLTSDNGKKELLIRLDILGCAKVLIDAIEIEPIE